MSAFDGASGLAISASSLAAGCDPSSGLGLDADACRVRTSGFGKGFGVRVSDAGFERIGFTMASLPLAPFHGWRCAGEVSMGSGCLFSMSLLLAWFNSLPLARMLNWCLLAASGAGCCCFKDEVRGLACAYFPLSLVVGSPEKSSHLVVRGLSLGDGCEAPPCPEPAPSGLRGTGRLLVNLVSCGGLLIGFPSPSSIGDISGLPRDSSTRYVGESGGETSVYSLCDSRTLEYR